MEKGKHSAIKIWAKEQAYLDKPESPRTSFYLDRDFFDPPMHITTFNFLDWPMYNEKTMVTVEVTYPLISWYSNQIITLHYVRSTKNHVVAHAKDLSSKRKAMSLITFEDMDIFNVIDTMINHYDVQDDDSMVFQHYVSLTSEKRKKKEKEDPNFNSVAILNFTLMNIEDRSLTVDEPTDIRGYPIQRFGLR